MKGIEETRIAVEDIAYRVGAIINSMESDVDEPDAYARLGIVAYGALLASIRAVAARKKVQNIRVTDETSLFIFSKVVTDIESYLSGRLIVDSLKSALESPDPKATLSEIIEKIKRGSGQS